MFISMCILISRGCTGNKVRMRNEGHGSASAVLALLEIMADSGEQHELVELVPATESQEDGATDRDIVDNNEPEVEEGYVSDGGRAGDQREVNIEADHDDEPPRELPTAPTERIVADYAGSERPERPPHINLCQV